MARVTKKRKAVFMSMGTEPEGSLVHFEQDDYRSNLIRVLNWYSQQKASKDAVAYLTAWAKKNEPKKVDALKTASPPSTLGWLARLELRGAVLSSEHKEHLVSFFNQLKGAPKQSTKSTAKRPTVQDAIREKIPYVLGEFEGLLDEVIVSGKSASVQNSGDVKAYLQTNDIGAVYVSALVEWARLKMGEFLTAYKDKDLKEGYSNIGAPRQQKQILSFLKACVDGAEEYSKHKKANRKPRVRKAQAPARQVAKMKYKISDDELSIKSVNPTEIIGARQLWVYNTKYRKLGVYKTDSALGLQVKGTSIQNYEPAQSVQKTLRKPADGIKQCLEAGKVTLRKLLDSFNAKEQSLNGRIGADTILLRVVK